MKTQKSQQSNQKRNKIKTGIFTAMFLTQYFCSPDILLFSKSKYEIESSWSIEKKQAKKVFWKWILHSYSVSVFHQNRKQLLSSQKEQS